MLAWYGDGAQDRGATAVLGFLAIERNQLFFGCRAAQLFLNGQDDLLNFSGVNTLEQAAKGRLGGSRILAFWIATDSERPALRLAQTPGEFGQILLPTRRAAERCQEKDRQHRPQWIGLETLAEVRHCLEVFDHRTDFLHRAGTCWRHSLFDHCQSRFEMFGLETKAGVFSQLPAKEAFGLIVFNVVIASS